jgi:Trk K+ transport system NAD-binding subunit
MDDRIQQLEQHYIVCGGGETGRHIVDELLASRKPVVLIEQDEDLVARFSRNDGLFGIAESGLEGNYDLLDLGFKEPTQELFNSSPSARLSAGTTLIVMGERSDIDRAKSDF